MVASTIRDQSPARRMIWRQWKGVALIAATLAWIWVLGGCSTTSHSVTSKIVAPKTIQPPKYVPTELIPYLPRFIGVLESQGFVVAQTEDPNALQLRLDLDPNPWNTQVSVSLWQGGSPILTSQATNPGWGNVIAHGAALANLVGSTATALEVEMRKLSPRLEIVADRAPGPGARPGSAGMSSGTAFGIGSPGWLLTAYHVVEAADSVSVECRAGMSATARVEKIDPANDLALLSTGLATPSVLDLADEDSATVGARVFTFGFPVPELLGKEPKYSEGVISSLSGLGGSASLLQITVPIQPGNSGGPLVDERGRVVGIVTSSAAVRSFLRFTGTLPQNINWAVRAEYVRPLVRGRVAAAPSPSTPGAAIERVRDSVCLVLATRSVSSSR
jgi:S1-C subfamily serine protease